MNPSFTVDPSIIADLSMFTDASSIVNPSITKDKRVFKHRLTAYKSIARYLRSAVKGSTTADPSVTKNLSSRLGHHGVSNCRFALR